MVDYLVTSMSRDGARLLGLIGAPNGDRDRPLEFARFRESRVRDACDPLVITRAQERHFLIIARFLRRPATRRDGESFAYLARHCGFRSALVNTRPSAEMLREIIRRNRKLTLPFFPYASSFG